MISGDQKPVLQAIGFVIVLAVIAAAVRARQQFTAHRASGSLPRATALFLVGGAVVLFGGGALVDEFGTAPNYPDALSFVYGEMLADIGRIGYGGSEVTAPCGSAP